MPVTKTELIAQQLASAAELKRAWGSLLVNVMDTQFGAVGDGVTDDTEAIQNAIDHAGEGGVIHFPAGRTFKFDTINVDKLFVTLTGGGTLLDGRIVIGHETTLQDMFYTVTGLIFETSPENVRAKNHIELRNARRGRIFNCTFYDSQYAIQVQPLVNAAFHGVAQAVIDNCMFYGVKRAFNVPKDPTSTWMATSDCHFTNNIVNIAYEYHVYCDAIDGIVISDNTFFFPNYGDPDTAKVWGKKNNIYIGESDWIHISNNNLFEAGHESIWCHMPQHVKITGNHIAWPGQLGLYDAIKFTGASNIRAIVSDNVLARFTRHGVYIGNNIGDVSVSDNIVEFDPTQAVNYNSYIGETPIDSITHYSVYQDPAISTFTRVHASNPAAMIDFNIRGTVFRRGQVVKIATITEVDTPLLSLTDLNDRLSTYDGSLHITVKQFDLSDTNSASYLIHIGKHYINSSVTVLSKNGLYSGGSANHPSFRFSIDETNNKLTVTPIGLTSGEFFFYASYSGNLKVHSREE